MANPEYPALEPDVQFRRCWRWLSQYGVCDAEDGMEYRRVLQEWRDQGRPEPINDFIRGGANRPAPNIDQAEADTTSRSKS